MTIPLVLEVQDQWGRTIRLTEEVWNNHVLEGHSELADHLNAVHDTLVTPDLVRYSATRPDGECFYQFGVVPTFPRRYLKVAVRFIAADGGIGYVSTIYLSRNVPPKEKHKWQR